MVAAQRAPGVGARFLWATAGPCRGPWARAAPVPSCVSFAPSALSSCPCAPPPPVGPCASRCPPCGSPSFGGSALWSFPRARVPLLQPEGASAGLPPWARRAVLVCAPPVFPQPPPPRSGALHRGAARRSNRKRGTPEPPCQGQALCPHVGAPLTDRPVRAGWKTRACARQLLRRWEIVRFIGHLLLWGLLPLSPPPLRPAGASGSGRPFDSVRFIGLNIFWGVDKQSKILYHF